MRLRSSRHSALPIASHPERLPIGRISTKRDKVGDASARRLGSYWLCERLAAGSATDTYLAFRESATSPTDALSVKVLPTFADVGEQREALGREAVLQARCVSSLIVPVLDHAVQEGASYIARPYVYGLTVAELWDGRPLPTDIALRVAISLLSGLEVVHGVTDADGRPLGLVHRDVTPGNVLVSLEGEVRLTDFGLAHAPGEAGRLADDQIAQGTPAYLTPEAASGEQPDPRSDLYQVGLLLGELLLGEHLRERGVRVSELGRDDVRLRLTPLTPRLRALLDVALEPSPSRRPRNAALLRDALSRQAGEVPATAERVAGWLLSEREELVQSERDRLKRAFDAFVARSLPA